MELSILVALVGGVFVAFSALINKHTEICKMENDDLSNLKKEVHEFYVSGSNMVFSINWNAEIENLLNPELGSSEYTLKMYEKTIEKAVVLSSELSSKEDVRSGDKIFLKARVHKRKCILALRGLESFNGDMNDLESVKKSFFHAHEVLNLYLVSKRKSVRSLRREIFLLFVIVVLILMVSL
ncbi:hypothetical protein [uncultured Salinicola sp.]|uniref:hypothetical protein n=1 Tax=uncultured Salinicola sp. TaxID=1193542 RepID=UPI00261DAF74|nr:hypothetical protein [uncultured Salinicola sp.]|tara:strand:- start:1016 stop:1561 length:546 start_codon:yes stop_codon:yes gene_type:complete